MHVAQSSIVPKYMCSGSVLTVSYLHFGSAQSPTQKHCSYMHKTENYRLEAFSLSPVPGTKLKDLLL